jgi:hypothetical protein
MAVARTRANAAAGGGALAVTTVLANPPLDLVLAIQHWDLRPSPPVLGDNVVDPEVEHHLLHRKQFLADPLFPPLEDPLFCTKSLAICEGLAQRQNNNLFLPFLQF